MENSKDNKEKILKVALELFSAKGFDAVGVQAICEKAGITKPTLYYHFGNKSGLLKAVLKTNYDELNSLLEKKSVYNPNPASYFKDVYPLLIRVTNAYSKFAKNNLAFYSMSLSALFAPPNSELSLLVKDFNKKQYDIIEKMFESISNVHGNMRGHEKRLAWTFIGMINTYITLNSNLPTKDWVHQFMHGIF